MIDLVIIVFSFFATTFAIKESVLFDRPRSWLISKHPFFYHLFSCYACVGFWSGIFVYLLFTKSFDVRDLFLYGLASSGISLFMNSILIKLSGD